MNCFIGNYRASILFLFVILSGCSENLFQTHDQLTHNIIQYEKAAFQVIINEDFRNPYDAKEIALNMILKSPSGDSLYLPCYFESGDAVKSVWMARFAPRESGEYSYYFQLVKNGKKAASSTRATFASSPSDEDGFLHINDLWTLKFDSGKPFRGIGENVGWESRSFSNPKWNYDYLLPTLSENGANFFRSWMSPNNFPLEWKTVKETKRYSDTDEYFNPGGIQRLDEVVELADSLGLYMMLAFDSHNTLMENNQWEIHNYNVKNGGPARTPTEFFTLEESKDKYRNRLRYIVARWGYSTAIGAWEFFNEIDNAAYNRQDSVLIPHQAITEWHQEMAAYLKSIDPYDHIVTTSVSHRQIDGMYALDELDLNQMHIYKRTDKIPGGIRQYTREFDKPFSWGEFGYEWDWNKDFEVIGEEMDFDYKRGLWYGLFSPTPILPMTWWWEFFDERGMTPYFRNVQEINDRMLAAGNGTFKTVSTRSDLFETYAVKCGETYFVYVLNNSRSSRVSDLMIEEDFTNDPISVEKFLPEDGTFEDLKNDQSDNGGLRFAGVKLKGREEMIVIITPQSAASR